MRIRMPTLPGICHAVKFKTRQFVPGTDSSNLILAKVSRYTVFTLICLCTQRTTCNEACNNKYVSINVYTYICNLVEAHDFYSIDRGLGSS